MGGGSFDWGVIYGLIATGCGYTWPQIDEMTLPQYAELAAYWRNFPPSHLLLRAAFGFKPTQPARGDLVSLLAEAGPGGIFSKLR